MRHTALLVDRLRSHEKISIRDDADSWSIRVPSGEFVCEVCVPRDVFEWFVEIRRSADREAEPIWKDWCDHYDAPDDHLDAERAAVIEEFVDRVLKYDLREVTESGVFRTKKRVEYRVDDAWRVLRIWAEEKKTR